MPKDDDLPVFRPKFGKARKDPLGSQRNAFRNAVLGSVRAAGGLARTAGRNASRPPAKTRILVKAPSAQSRRAVLKARVVQMKPGAAAGAALHLAYIQREGVERDGSPGQLYGPEGPVAAEHFERSLDGEKHQFRFILSPEDGEQLDMQSYVRRFMDQVERDVGRRLDWGAVNHHDTDNPHAHIVIRGIDRDGASVRFDREYIANGMRARAQEIATLDLGPRTALDLHRARNREIHQERFTSLDRELQRQAVDALVTVRREARARVDPATLTARLEHLGRLQLAERVSATSWRLAPDWSERLKALGIRGDIIKQMHAALHGDPARYRELPPPPAPGQAPQPLYGRLVHKGLSDELAGKYYAVLETPDGSAYHVPLGAKAAEQLRRGDLVAFSAAPTKTPAPATAKDRSDHPRVVVRALPLPLAQQVHHPGPVWLDQVDPGALAPYGLGAEIRDHLLQRQAHLRAIGIAPNDPERLTKLRALEQRAVGEGIAQRAGQAYLHDPPALFRGRLQDPVKGADGTPYAIISDGTRIAVVPVSPDAALRPGQLVALKRDDAGRLTVQPLRRERDVSR